MSEEEAIIRAYELAHRANAGKLSRLRETLVAYRSSASSIEKVQWKYFYTYFKFNKKLDIKHLPLPLSARYRQTCQWQVVGMLESFLSNLKNDFVDIVRRSMLSDEQKMQLCYVNKYNKWFKKEVKIQKKLIDPDLLKIARKVIKRLFKKHRKPSMKNINMALDAKVATIEERKSPGATSFDYWANISTIEKGNKVNIPLSTNHYFDSQEGTRKNFIQVNQDENGSFHFHLIKELAKPAYKAQLDEINLDIGLKVLFATENGDLFGRHFYAHLQKMDDAITSLAAGRQSDGLPVRCKKYDNLVRKLSEYLKNEIHRCLNKIVETYSPKKIRYEDLNFTHPSLTKRMNRLVKRFGLGIIKEKLESLKEEYGIELEKVNPAYTSRECSSCGYVDKRNRRTRDRFECKSCGIKLHADVSGARTTKGRSSLDGGSVYTSKERVLQALVRRHVQRLEQQGCQSRLASEPYVSNHYFHEAHKGFSLKEHSSLYSSS